MNEISTLSVRRRIGIDMGDRRSEICALDGEGNVQKRRKVATERGALQREFERVEPARVVLEAGTHSPWMSRLLEELGHEVVVANPRQVPLISTNVQKDDRRDAELLARLGRVDPKLLAPVRHRSAKAQRDRALVAILDRSRVRGGGHHLVPLRARTRAVAAARQQVTQRVAHFRQGRRGEIDGLLEVKPRGGRFSLDQ